MFLFLFDLTDTITFFVGKREFGKYIFLVISSQMNKILNNEFVFSLLPTKLHDYMTMIENEAKSMKEHAESIKEQLMSANKFQLSIEKLTTVLQERESKSKCSDNVAGYCHCSAFIST